MAMKNRILKRFLVWFLLLGHFGVGCGDAVWFVSFNSGQADDALLNGFVLVIGTPHTEPLESVSLVEGDLPPGMEIHDNGTVQGIPEESGSFDFTLELTETSGKVLRKSYSVQVEAPKVASPS